jgi:hypothetical protein
MIDYIAVPHATAFPQSCVCCLSQKGPFVDTHRESPTGHVYVCSACAKTIARVMGFAEGRKLDELADAAGSVHTLEREIDGLREALGEREGALLTAGLRIKEADEHMSIMQGRIEQLEGRLRAHAAAALSLVGSGDEAA